MMERSNNLETASGAPADVLLRQLFHLKGYETPDPARMTRNRQNIMRQVREANSRRRWSLADLLEVNIPWFFAEPKYGIAALFIAFASLQYLGINTRNTSQNQTGIYAPDGSIAMAGQSTTFSTNGISYPKLPDHLPLFPDRQGDDGVRFVGRIDPRK